MTIMEQQLYQLELGKDYPQPIVNLKETAKFARDKIWAHRENPLVKKEGKRILYKHVLASKIKKTSS